MQYPDLNQRKKKILNWIIRSHIDTVMPVGSETIARESSLGLSSATIRNEMADLERIGYLRHLHTSSGRVPTDRGYRYYVDYLMKSKRISEEEFDRIKRTYMNRERTLEDMMTEASQILSNLTSYTGMVLLPKTETGYSDYHGRLRLEGSWNILNYPEFHDFDIIKKIFEAFERKSLIFEILNEDIEKIGVHIHIGSENKSEELQHCSLVISRYGIEDEMIGGLGIIGPVRMDYERVVPVVNFLAEAMTDYISEFYH